MKSELVFLYHIFLWCAGRLPYKPMKVWGRPFLGRSEVPNSSNKDKAFMSDLSDHICDFLEDAQSMGRITKQKKDNWYAALGKMLPDLRQKLVPRKQEVLQEYLQLHRENVAKHGYGATPMIVQLRNSIK